MCMSSKFPRLLTKSRYKQALECPNKLFYTNKPHYTNTKQEDSFLASLAQGGFQVEELARLEYSDGILIDGNSGDYDQLVNQTNEWLKRDNIVLFEAAFRWQNLFVRCDIIVKRGDTIQLIEVKAKSSDPHDEYEFIGKRGNIVSSWKPYLYDVAFQRYVVQQSNPHWHIKSYFKLANKTAVATVNGLNQLFRIKTNIEKRTGVEVLAQNNVELGDKVLVDRGVCHILDDIESGKHSYHEPNKNALNQLDNQGMGFEEQLLSYAQYYQKDEKYGVGLNYKACKNCEYKNHEDTSKSGFHECFVEQTGCTIESLSEPMIFDVWNFRGANKHFDSAQYWLKDIDLDDFPTSDHADHLEVKDRHYYQIKKSCEQNADVYLAKQGLAKEIKTWVYPLNFIDFETSAVALPFHKGMRPYEQVAFQFSHHIVDSDGTITHANEYISTKAGEFPNFEFVRQLKQALEVNQGSVFKYSHHENTILNKIHEQLSLSQESDKDELLAFIETITHYQSKGNQDPSKSWRGNRDMIDLCETVKRYYYDPYLNKGSISIKSVLPAILKRSEFLQAKYSTSIGNLNITSKNFDHNHVWLSTDEQGEVYNPYQNLPELFTELDDDQLDQMVSELVGSIDNGGQALIAYAKLQYTNMTELERQEITQSLLKYCELDTLAMVMLYEFLKQSVTK